MTPRPVIPAVIFLAAFVFYSSLFVVPARAVRLIDAGYLDCELSGNLKGFYLGIHDSDFSEGRDGGLTLLRLIVSGSATDGASFEFHLLEGGMINPHAAAPSGLVTFSSSERFRAHRWTHTQSTHEDFSAYTAVDRANVTLHLPRCDVTVGRQAISLGTTYFWNPSDLLTSFSPYEFDRDYKPGVDAIVAEIALGEFSGITLLYGAGKYFRLDESAFLARVFGNIRDFDVALMAGRYREDAFAGADFSGEAGPGIGIRGAAACYWAENDNDFFQVVVGAEYRFENDLYLSAEYFYNGFGTPHSSRYLTKVLSERIMQGDFYNISRHYLGVLGSYEVTPLLIVSLAVIVNINDKSMLIDPTVIYSLGDNAEFVAGMVIATGRKARGLRLKSEFGAYPDFSFVEIKYYF